MKQIEELTYNGFCALGALTNPKLFTRAIYIGKHFSHTIYLIRNF